MEVHHHEEDLHQFRSAREAPRDEGCQEVLDPLRRRHRRGRRLAQHEGLHAIDQSRLNKEVVLYMNR